MKTVYIVTAKWGMTPFATVKTLTEAKLQRRKAKRLGLDGVIIKHDYNAEGGAK